MGSVALCPTQCLSDSGCPLPFDDGRPYQCTYQVRLLQLRLLQLPLLSPSSSTAVSASSSPLSTCIDGAIAVRLLWGSTLRCNAEYYVSPMLTIVVRVLNWTSNIEPRRQHGDAEVDQQRSGRRRYGDYTHTWIQITITLPCVRSRGTAS